MGKTNNALLNDVHGSVTRIAVGSEKNSLIYKERELSREVSFF